MTTYHAGDCDVAVIGAGHAGIEAALAAARLGLSTILFTINMDAVANLPCNPAIGGTGKGHLVRELDALGGEMAVAADKACIQYRMLNRGKGPAVHSLRAQADRRKYQQVMKHTLELQENLQLKQAQITAVLTENGAITGGQTQLGAIYTAKAAVIATGTYLDSTIITGESVIPSGPDGMHPSIGLADNLRALGLPLRRFKTGTPPRINRRSVDFSKMELQPGDDIPEPFSFRTETPVNNTAVCHLTYTNERTHEIIRANFHRSPMFDGLEWQVSSMRWLLMIFFPLTGRQLIITAATLPKVLTAGIGCIRSWHPVLSRVKRSATAVPLPVLQKQTVTDILISA